MKILVAGGAGEVGRHLSQYLVKQGHQVMVLDKTEASRFFHTGIVYHQADLTDRVAVRQAVAGNDAVINLAWSFADDPKILFTDDIIGHLNLQEEAVAASVNRFVYTSTAAVYGKPATSQIGEDCSCRPEDARKPFYAVGKECAEKLCLAFGREKGLPVAILRFWWAYGEKIGGRHLRELVRQALSNQPLRMVRGAGGEFVSMADLARAIELVLLRPQASGQIYNIGSLFMTWREIATRIIELTGSKSELQLVSNREWNGPAFLNEVWKLSSNKARCELGFEAQLGAETARSEFRRVLAGCVKGMIGHGE